MRLQFRFGGDYATEFGGVSRKWRVYYLIGKNVTGSVHEEPDGNGGVYYLLYNPDFAGRFKTRKALYNAARQIARKLPVTDTYILACETP